MANWQREIRLNPWWTQAKDGSLTTQGLAEKIAEKLSALRRFGDPLLDNRRDDLVWAFTEFSKSASGDKEEFDSLMDELYDWGDIRIDNAWPYKKVCWIDTMSLPKTTETSDE